MKKIYVLPALVLVIVAYYYSKRTVRSKEEISLQYKDKTVLLCGGSSGIGEEVVYQLAELGARIMIVSRRENRLIKVREEALKRGSPQTEYIVYDFSDVKNSGDVVMQTIQKFGTIDYLIVNHAAMVNGAFLAFPHQQQPDYIEKVFGINTFSFIEIVLKSLPYLEQSSGHIFITSSLAGEVSASYRHHLYSATKHALNGFFYSLQSELIFKKSPVGLTIGAFGLILTKDLEQIFDHQAMPGIFKGSVVDCARGMIEAYIDRPRTMTYPISNWFLRLQWMFNPYFHEFMNKSGVVKGDYEDSIKKTIEKAKLAKDLGFQEGYQDAANN